MRVRKQSAEGKKETDSKEQTRNKQRKNERKTDKYHIQGQRNVRRGKREKHGGKENRE
jgi:hypothetical protein